jgi:hypothetical protein
MRAYEITETTDIFGGHSKDLKKTAFLLNPILGEHGKQGTFDMSGKPVDAFRWGTEDIGWNKPPFNALLIKSSGYLMFRMSMRIMGSRDLGIGVNATNEQDLLKKIGDDARSQVDKYAPKSRMSKSAVAILEKLEQL